VNSSHRYQVLPSDLSQRQQHLTAGSCAPVQFLVTLHCAGATLPSSSPPGSEGLATAPLARLHSSDLVGNRAFRALSTETWMRRSARRRRERSSCTGRRSGVTGHRSLLPPILDEDLVRHYKQRVHLPARTRKQLDAIHQDTPVLRQKSLRRHPPWRNTSERLSDAPTPSLPDSFHGLTLSPSSQEHPGSRLLCAVTVGP
jgi:hypothetical protein